MQTGLISTPFSLLHSDHISPLFYFSIWNFVPSVLISFSKSSSQFYFWHFSFYPYISWPQQIKIRWLRQILPPVFCSTTLLLCRPCGTDALTPKAGPELPDQACPWTAAARDLLGKLLSQPHGRSDGLHQRAKQMVVPCSGSPPDIWFQSLAACEPNSLLPVRPARSLPAVI